MIAANMRLVEIVGQQARQLRVTWPVRLRVDDSQAPWRPRPPPTRRRLIESGGSSPRQVDHAAHGRNSAVDVRTVALALSLALIAVACGNDASTASDATPQIDEADSDLDTSPATDEVSTDTDSFDAITTSSTIISTTTTAATDSAVDGPDDGKLPGCVIASGSDLTVAFFEQMVTARTTGELGSLDACVEAIPEVFTGELPACWTDCDGASREFIEESIQVSTSSNVDGSELLIMSFAVTYTTGSGPVDVREFWPFNQNDDLYTVRPPSLERPTVERDRSHSLIAEFVGHIGSGEWTQAAALYSADGQNWDERLDLIELAPETFDVPGVAAALEQWCADGCDRELPTVDELTLRRHYGLNRNDAWLDASWFEGIYSIYGLPFRTSRP